MGRNHDIPISVFPDDHLVTVLGHELGNVLNGLLGMTELLEESGLDADQRRWLEAIRMSGEQMHALIRFCRRWHGGDAAGLLPRNTRIDGIDLLEQVVVSHAPAAHARNNRLVLMTCPELPRHWHCDACLVRQLLDNLIGNAIKFTACGDIIVEARPKQSANNRRTLEICVSDTGPGISDAVAESLFEAYLGGGATSVDETGGRGLGLYVCQQIVQSMKGHIDCSNTAGAGARFRVSLPDTLLMRADGRAHSRSLLLDSVQCEPELKGPLRRSVQYFLDRLGVCRNASESANPRDSDRTLLLMIRESRGRAGGRPGLLLKPRCGFQTEPAARELPEPVLESSLGMLLLEMALEWQVRVRNGKQG